MITAQEPPNSPPDLDDEVIAPERGSGNASALWLLVTGAALLVIAAALFVVVNWDELGPEARLVLLAGSTVGIATAAHQSGARLPLTSVVLTHLTVALVPVNAAAVASRLTSDLLVIVLAAAWSTIVGAGWLVATTRSPLALITGSAALPVGVFGLAGYAGLDPLAAGIVTAVAAVPVWGTVQLTDLGLHGARWHLPTITLLAGAALGTGATSWLADPANPNGIVTGVALVLAGLMMTASGLLEQRSGWIGLGTVTALLGTWTTAEALTISQLEVYLVPLAAVLLAHAAFHLARDGSVRRDELWFGSVLLTLGSIVERSDSGGAGHLLLGVIFAVALCAGGAQLRLGPPVLVGTGSLVTLIAIEVVDLDIQVATWAWVGGAGLVLAVAGALMERAESGPVEIGRNVGDWYRGSFR